MTLLSVVYVYRHRRACPDRQVLSVAVNQSRNVPLTGVSAVHVELKHQFSALLNVSADSGVVERLFESAKTESTKRSTDKRRSAMLAKKGDWLEYHGEVRRKDSKDSRDEPKSKSAKDRAKVAARERSQRIAILRHTVVEADESEQRVKVELRIGGKAVGSKEIVLLADSDVNVPATYLPDWDELPVLPDLKPRSVKIESSGRTLQDGRTVAGSLTVWQLRSGENGKGTLKVNVHRGNDIPFTGMTALYISDGNGMELSLSVAKDSGVLDRILGPPPKSKK